MNSITEFFVASCTNDGGVYRFELYEDGSLKQKSKIPMDRPMFLELRGNKLYATERAAGNIITLSAEGEKLNILSSVSCRGKEPRDITLVANERFVICTNQFSDNITLFKTVDDGTVEYVSSFSVPAPLCAVKI